MKVNQLKAQTIFLMVSAMHNYIKRLSNDPSYVVNESIRQKIRATENSFYHLSEVAEVLNSKTLKLDFKKAA